MTIAAVSVIWKSIYCTRVIKGTKVITYQKNVFQGQRPDMENRHTQQRA